MRVNPFFWAIAAAAAFTAGPALAQDAPAGTDNKADSGQTVAKTEEGAAEAEEPTKPITFEIDLAGVSDYRFRGISLSNKRPAFQPSVTVSHESGFYVGAWGSNVAENDGADIELDLIGGFAKTLGTFDVDVNATYYLYPGARELNYVEFIGNVSHAVGPATIGATFAYTPKQDDAAPRRGIYYGVNGSLPIAKTPISLNASFGIEDNGFYRNKRDWSLGATADVAGFSIGAAYVDTAHTGGDRLGKAGVVVSISRAFEF